MLFILPFPIVDPVAVAIGPFAIRWYALAYVAGIFLGWWYAKRLVATPRLWGDIGPSMTARDIDDFVVYAALGIILGGRAGYVLFYDLPRFAAEPAEIFALWHGGMSFHGGFIGTVLAMIIFARWRKIRVWSLIDVIAPSVTFGLFFGRLANFINGELFGRVTDVPWAMIFPNGGPDPRHPSELYEACLEGLVLFAILRLCTHRWGKLAQPGFISGVFALGYGCARIFVEMFREPDVQIGYLPGGITLGMLLSMPLVVIGIGLMVWASRRRALAVPARE